MSYSRPGTGVISNIDLVEAIPSIMSILVSQSSFKNMTVEYKFEADSFR